MKTITGQNRFGQQSSLGSGAVFHAINPATGERLEPPFHDADTADVDRAVRLAEVAFRIYCNSSPDARARFLRAIADELLGLGSMLVERVTMETALPPARIESERARTVNQLRLFADVVEEGSWVEARIDPGDPARSPVPKPDVRRMLVPLGPVAVFGASNFPLAFSVPGGDTATALAAGCTVVCKAHPAHPGTSELAAGAILRAAQATGMPDGVFSLVHGASHEVGLTLVRHPLITAVGFTGSIRGGRAVFDAACARPVPIPVYAEMGSINPIFLLPSALERRADLIADALAQSITLGVGQFCTSPGVLLAIGDDAAGRLQNALAAKLDSAPAGVMLHDGIATAYRTGVERMRAIGATRITSRTEADDPRAVRPALLRTDAERFRIEASLREETFGPVSILVAARDTADLERAANALEGQLTATVHGSTEDLKTHARLIDILRRKVGRIIFNGVPTGVEVGHAMHHGGPYPASSDARTTSVGTAAIARFARPVCFQDFPNDALPVVLRDRNESGIWRMIDGRLTREDVSAGG